MYKKSGFKSLFLFLPAFHCANNFQADAEYDLLESGCLFPGYTNVI